MAILLLDIGNTRTKAMLYQQGELQPIDAIHELIPSDISAVYCASVGSPERVAQIQAEIGVPVELWQQVHSEAHRFGLCSAYREEPTRLGVDRWLAMLGAKQLYPEQDILVVDAGTAMTVDYLTRNGQHQGGWIVPGLQMMQRSVTNSTAKVSNRPEQSPQPVFGVDTASCLQNGALSALLATMVQAQQLAPTAKMLITGGDAPMLMPYCQSISVEFEPYLVFYGLSCYIENSAGLSTK